MEVSERREVRLYLANVPYRATTKDVDEFCSLIGEAESVTIPVDKATKLPKGFCFATVHLWAGVTPEEAVEKLHHEFMPDPAFVGQSRKITVEIADPNPMERRRSG